MANAIVVMTTNELKAKDGGYHEIHDINHLNSPEHAIATVESVIANNIKFTDANCPLVDVVVECRDLNTFLYLQNYYKTNKEVTVSVCYIPTW